MQPPKSFVGEKIWKPAKFGAMPDIAENEPNPRAIRERLKAVRYLVAGDNQTKFAKEMGFEVTRWNNFERTGNLSKDAAFVLVRKIQGLSLDWLFFGNEAGVTRQRLHELKEAATLATTVRAGESVSTRKVSTSSRA